MGRLIDLIRGWPGKPSHPPLTDASIGAYTVGVAMLVAGKLGLEKHQMAYGSLIAISGGLALGLAAEALLAIGGYIGGTLVFAYGVRVVKRSDATVAEALIPGRLAPEASDQAKATEVP